MYIIIFTTQQTTIVCFSFLFFSFLFTLINVCIGETQILCRETHCIVLMFILYVIFRSQRPRKENRGGRVLDLLRSADCPTTGGGEEGKSPATTPTHPPTPPQRHQDTPLNSRSHSRSRRNSNNKYNNTNKKRGGRRKESYVTPPVAKRSSSWGDPKKDKNQTFAAAAATLQYLIFTLFLGGARGRVNDKSQFSVFLPWSHD